MSRRVAVFLDCQNSYGFARTRFAPRNAPASYGNIDPHALGSVIAGRRGEPSHLLEIRVYTGLPDAYRDSKGASATMRMLHAHTAAGNGKVVYVPRPLRYPPDWRSSPAFQKGVDVALAVDYVAMGIRGEYDVGVIFSSDSDLAPALEAVLQMPTDRRPSVEVAAWGTPTGHHPRLSTPVSPVWCHWLDQSVFDAVADHTNYTVKAT